MNRSDEALRRLETAIAVHEAEEGTQSNGLRRYVDDIKALIASYREQQGRVKTLEHAFDLLEESYALLEKESEACQSRWEKLKELLEGQRAHIGSDGPAVCYVHEVVTEMDKLEKDVG